jgi:hypothetical protein
MRGSGVWRMGEIWAGAPIPGPDESAKVVQRESTDCVASPRFARFGQRWP